MNHPNLPKIAAAAIASERATGFPAEIAVAQCAIESGWLSAMSGQNNCFGIKATGDESAKLVWTKEWFTDEQAARFLAGRAGRTLKPTGRVQGNKKEFHASDWFRSYATLADCFTDHACLITEGERYTAAWKRYQDDHSVDALIAGIAKAGYATAPNYAKQIGQIAHQSDVQIAVQRERARQEGVAS